MLNTAPNDWTILGLQEHLEHGPQTDLSGVGDYAPARPMGFYSLGSRIRLAWAVFTGRADALFWPGQMPRAY